MDELSVGEAGRKHVNKNNAGYSILFESINLIIHYNLSGSHELLGQAIALLGSFISAKDTNLLYLSLETMTRLSKIPGTAESIKKHEAVIINILKDGDVYLRRRSLDLLFNICDKTNSKNIVHELLANLARSDVSIREETVLKIAILAENFASSFKWYIDVILKLITLAGDYLADEIWYRVIQIVTNNEELQAYAAQRVYEVSP